MPDILSMLPRIAPVVVRHLAAYLELAAADAALLARSQLRRTVAAVVALLGALLAMLLGCAWLIAAAWDTPWRTLVNGLLMALFLLLATVGAALAARRQDAATEAVAEFRKEWRSDEQLVQELAQTTLAAGATHVLPQVRLQQSRQELRVLLTDAAGAQADDAFPRSATMRLLRLIPVAAVTRLLLNR